MRNKFAALMITLTMAAIGMTGVAAADTDDSGFGAADAGSLGIVEDTAYDTYCAADAGSFGLPNPAALCSMER